MSTVPITEEIVPDVITATWQPKGYQQPETDDPGETIPISDARTYSNYAFGNRC
jgi:hypothetical protein